MSDDATLDEFTGDSEESNESDMTAESNQTTDDLQTLEASPVEGWELLRLGDVLSFEYGDNLPANTRQDGEIPVYGSNGQVDTHTEANVDRAGIIIGRKGSIGEGEFSNKPFWAIDTTYYISGNETNQNLRFIYYLLQNMELKRLNAASAIPGLNRNDAYNLNALVPPLSEQRKIATVFHTIDQAIQKSREVVEKIEIIKKGIKQDILTTGLDNSPTQDVRIVSQEVEISSQWEVVPLPEIAKSGENTFIDGDWVESSDMVEDGEYQLIQLGNIGEGRFKGECNRYVSEEFFEEENCTLVEQGDLLISRMAEPILRTLIVPEFDRKSITAVDIVIAKIDESEWDKRYIKYLLNSKAWENIAEALASGSTRKRISRENMSRILIPKPSLESQQKIADIVESIENQATAEREQIKQFQRLKQGLMQDLLSGKVRTTDANIHIPEEVAKYG